MASIPKKVSERLVDGIKKFMPIIEAAKAKDIGEADTVMQVRDILIDMFGYETTEITSELAIRGRWCDLAVKIEEKVQTLIEVKGIGHELKDSHVDQAVGYAANHDSCVWVILTNGQHWRAYKVINSKPIERELVVEFDFLNLNHKSEDDLAVLYLFCKEGWAKSAIEEYETQKDALNRFSVGAVLLSEPVLTVICRELKRLTQKQKVHVDAEEIQQVLETEVIKREVLEGDKAEEARRRVAKAANVVLRKISDEKETV